MLQMVIYITNGIITDWGTPLLSPFWVSKLPGIIYEYVVWNGIQYVLRSAPMLWQWGTSCSRLHMILNQA